MRPSRSATAIAPYSVQLNPCASVRIPSAPDGLASLRPRYSPDLVAHGPERNTRQFMNSPLSVTFEVSIGCVSVGVVSHCAGGCDLRLILDGPVGEGGQRPEQRVTEWSETVFDARRVGVQVSIR